MGKTHEMEIEKFEEELKKLVMKPTHSGEDIECMHYFAEAIYYLVAADTMIRSEHESGNYMNMESSRMMPYDYKMNREYGREMYPREAAPYGGRY